MQGTPKVHKSDLEPQGREFYEKYGRSETFRAMDSQESLTYQTIRAKHLPWNQFRT